MDSVEGGGLRRALAAAALVLSTLVAGMAGIAVSAESEVTAAWWPAAGVALLAVLVSPRRWWSAVYAGLYVAYFLSNYLMARDGAASVGLALGDTVGTALVAHVLVSTVGRRLHRVQDTWWLLLAAVQGSFVAGLVVASTSATLMGGEFWLTVATTTVAHTASIVVIAPVLMAPAAVHRFPRAQLLAQVLILAAVVWFSFGTERLNLAFALYPLTIWAAVSFGTRILAVEQLLLAAGIAALTSDGGAVFEARARDLPLELGSQSTQLYLVTLVVSSLPLALAMRQRIEAVEVVAARERSFQENFLSSAVPTALLTYDGGRLVFDEVNRPARTMLRRGAGQLRGVHVDEVLTGPLSLVIEAHDLAEGHEASWSGTRELSTSPARHIDVSMALIGKSEGVHRLSMTLHDATEEREMQRRLQAEQEYNRAITDSSPSPVIVMDDDGRVQMANPAAVELSGFTEEQLVGHPIWESIVPPEQRWTVAKFFERDRPMPLRGESTIVTASGERRQLIFASRPLDTGTRSESRQVITATDVTEERKVAQLMSHLLASATTVAFIGTDVDGRITVFNQGATRMLAISSADAIGHDFLGFLRISDVQRRARSGKTEPGFAAVVGRVADGGPPETHDWTWVATTGSTVQVSMTVSRMADNLGTTLGYFFVARDVSDTRRSQQILVKALDRERQAVAKLQALDSVRDDFISTVSHELRTPMTSIIGSAEMLTDGVVGELDGAQRALIEVIARNGERLLALANDLLALAQNDVPGWAEGAERLDLRTIVVESHESVLQMRTGRSLEILTETGEQPLEVYGDVQKLERAVTNLLSNAIKFTPDGGRVSTTLSCDPDLRIARLVVADSGLGIPEGEIDRVFERFYRSSRVQELAIQGTGLGLPIVKDIVESHHGTIQVDSLPGQGTRFTIELPLADASPLAAVSDRTTPG